MSQREIVYDAFDMSLSPELIKAKIGNWLPNTLVSALDNHGVTLTIIAGIVAAISWLLQAPMSIIVICFSVVALFLGVTLLIEMAKRTLRLELFCSQNNFTYLPSLANPTEQGMIFQQGSSRRFADVISGKIFDRDFMLANYSYKKSGKNRQTYSYGCIKLTLPRVLPHMVLDATQNNLFGNMTNLPALFDDDQKLSLEGDFDSHFTLYCPKEYERDALYIFTPDLMALLIDESATFDIEIIDNSMYLYSMGMLSVTNRIVLQQVFSIVAVVGEAVDLRADNYSDERVGNNTLDTVALGGARLKPLGINLSALIVLIIIAGIFVWLLATVGTAFLRALP